MNAISYTRFGPAEVFRYGEATEPRLADTDVLVDVRATSVNVIDIRTRDGKMWPLVNRAFPKIPGSDLAGVVQSVGRRVSTLKPGDAVFGATHPFKGGAFADAVAVPAGMLAPLPRTLSFEQAAAVPITGSAALTAVRDLGRVKAGSRLLVYGSSGSAGLFAVQLGKHFGAEVTAVAGTRGAAASRDAGADRAIDYKAGPVVFEHPFDAVIDFSGAFPFAAARRHLTPTGRFVEASPTIPVFLGSKLANPFRRQKHLMLETVARTADLEFLAELIDAGRLRVTVAHTYPLTQAVEAFREQERGGVVGKIVVTV